MRKIDQLINLRDYWFLVLASVLLFSLSGCGYHLRGSNQLPAEMSVTFVKAKDLHGEIAAGLRRQLKASGVQVTSNRAEATAVLEVLQDHFDRRVLSVGSTGKAREFEFHHAITFQVLDPKGKAILKRGQVSVTRSFLFDETNVLGKTNEASLVKKEMQQDLVRQILLRLAAVST